MGPVPRGSPWSTLARSVPLLLVSACAAHQPAAAPAPLATLERRYETLRYWDDRHRLLASLVSDTLPGGLARRIIDDSLQVARARFDTALARTDSTRLVPADRAALATMVEAWNDGLQGTTEDEAGAGDSLGRLSDAVYRTYGEAALAVVVGRDTLNRLSILGRLGREDDPVTRRRLFLALAPVWQTINGDNGPASPYRTMLRLRRAAWGDSASPVEAKAPAFGLTTAALERWLTDALSAWRAALPDTLIEPWDWYYDAGEASRRLSPRVPAVPDLARVNQAFYATLGAPPDSLHIHYDLLPRPGKDPVAFTDFGSRRRHAPDGVRPTEPWVFTAYLEGGFDNLAELLHETGHGIHIAAIDTRPAWVDWPDNDTFTEALADLAALDLYEPAWQQRFLGDSASLAASLRARYAGIMMDMTWALFEIRVHREPGVDPNRLWADLTSRYLGIVPHPEWSWWAMRGQLIGSPGYLINYAFGAFLTADLRARAARRGHPVTGGDRTLYRWLSRELYRYGRELSARAVLERFLGGPVRPDALLTDLARLGPPESAQR